MKYKIIPILLAIIILFTSFAPESIASGAESNAPIFTRISGKSRYDTACQIAAYRTELISDTAEAVIIANGLSYADALAGVPLSAQLNAPILLTANQGTLESSVLNQISVLGVSSAFVLGGPAVVSEDIISQLRALGMTVTRLSGQSRYDTAVQIASYNANYADISKTVFLVSGENFPDALSAGAAAGIMNSNILFCPQNGEIKDPVAEFIEKNNINEVVIVGGPSAVSERAELELAEFDVSVRRVYGTSRYATSLAVYNEFHSIFAPDILTFATGADFPDALAGGALSSELQAPVVLVNNNKDNTAIINVIKRSNIKTVYVYGGENAISPLTIDLISGKPVTTTTSTTTTTTRTTTSTTASGYGKNAKNVVNPDYKSKYYIVVYAGESQSVAVYSKDSSGKYSVLTKCFTCSTGAPSSPTRTGQYKIWRRFRWRLLVGNVYGQYSTSISKSYLFHSVPYFKQDPSTLDMTEYDKLGSPASHGCIRLCVRDAKWIYENCPNGTQVNIVNASGPTGAGVPKRTKNNTYKGWDPSDPASNNPYNKVTTTSSTTVTTVKTTTTTAYTGPWADRAAMDLILENIKTYAQSLGIEWDTTLDESNSMCGASTRVITAAYYSASEYEARVKEKIRYYLSSDAGYTSINVIISERANGEYAMTCCFA